ncbi:TVG1262323 [Thermoplasma volcanium GSS1]|uniref:TVG1262323 protein n=1 Tax=Thermoplasma volcanium (strain ATCC 51530 / DSM 4299 / JCM 9571 / NBRC 15438 / GSS1) TaxID=273116 RepID=Q979D6_THEVO|nr:TVG1262323 [Thermoplasma volcanium GSS1]
MWILIGLIAVVVVLSLIPIGIYGVGYRGPYFGMMGLPYYGMYFFMPIMAAISILVIILFIYLIAGAFHDGSIMSDENSRATEILKERYAKGEISEEEYRKKLDELKK